jgi:hypothetical protein
MTWPKDSHQKYLQAGAELFQAWFKLGLAKTVFPDIDIVLLLLYFLYQKFEVVFQLQIIEVVFHLPKI